MTVDLSGYRDLVVILLGMRVNEPRGLVTLLRTGRRIMRAVDARPDGLLLHEFVTWSLLPLNFGMRQYWRDFDSLEAWARSGVHADWWREFLSDTRGTGFWHETYCMRGGIEAVYDDLPRPVGLLRFAPAREARGGLFSARGRLGSGGQAQDEAPVPEAPG